MTPRALNTPRIRRTALASIATAGAAAAALTLAQPAHAGTPQATHPPKATTTASAVHAQADTAKTADKTDKADGAKADKNTDTKQTATHGDNVDAWLHQALGIMHKKHIPGSYDGLKRNITRESGGNPHAVNNWDINAQKGTPSKGLLQMIQPTFDQYHVKGTKNSITDPVANITAAANYASDRYGTMDNVDSAY